MKLTALVEHPDHVSCRYRLAAFRPHLAAAGHSLELVPFPKSLLARLRLYKSMADSDAVILQRTLLNAFELQMLRRSAKTLIYDFDDAIWLRDSYAKRSLSRKRRSRFGLVCQAADKIFAGNDFLRDTAAKFGAHATTLPTCVDRNAIRAGSVSDGESIRLVWIGSRSTLQSLERLRPTLEAVGQAIPGLTLRLICDAFTTFQHLRTEHIVWNAQSESHDIATSDVGIATMPDDDWSRGKCGLKVLQYMAAGLPVIADPIGVHTAMIEPDRTGFLASTPEQWIDAIRLLQSPSLRTQLGTASRRVVADRYSVEVGAGLWCDALSGFAAPARRLAC